MESQALSSIYQQYKHDTNLVASWLASTAKVAGFNSPIGEIASRKVPYTGRPKGKDRKLAKAARLPKNVSIESSSTAESSASGDPPKPKYTLAIKEFVPLAEYIANTSETTRIKLPTSFSVALERVVWVRKSFSEKLESAGRILNQKSNARHSYFVEILEKVRKTLQPLSDPDTFNLSNLKEAISNVDTHREKKGLSSLFEVLDVYEPSAAFEAAPDITISRPSEIEYTIDEEENAEFEGLFAITTLMGDLSRLRIEIGKLWAKYEAGDIDIAAASVATNAAVELARSFEDEISPLVEKNGGVSMFHNRYFEAVSGALGINTAAKQSPDDDYNFAAYDIADALFINTLANIIAHVRANPLGEIADYNGFYGWFDENSTWRSGSGPQRYAKMKPALLEVLSDIPLMSNAQNPVEDQLICGMMATLRNAKRDPKKIVPDVPIWFSFAAQIYLDTLNVVKIGKGWTDMQREIRNVKHSIHSLPASCAERKRLLEDLELWDKGIDPVAMIRQSLGKPYRDYTFLRRHFLHCGLWVHFLRVRFHQQGVTYAAVPGTVLYTTQLYHALQQEHHLNSTWVDLDALRMMQGNSTFFLGDPPTTLEGYHNNFLLTIGASIQNWAPNRRDQRVKVTKDNKPIMKFLGMTSTLAATRLTPGKDQRPVSAAQLEDWIKKGEDRGRFIVSQNGMTQRGPGNGKTREGKSRQQPLIERLAAAVTAEIPHLEFDYFAIHNMCQELLQRLKIRIEATIGPEPFRAFSAYGKLELAYLVGFVFSSAAGKKGVVSTTVPSTRLLEIAIETVNQWLAEGKGGVITGREWEDDA